MAERIFQIFAGLVLFVAGAGIIYAFHILAWHRGHDIWDAGFLLLAEAYSIIGSLFILLGLRYAFGRRSFCSRRCLALFGYCGSDDFYFEMRTWSNKALEPTPVGAFSSAFAVDIVGPAWLSLSR